ncbi:MULTISPECIES: sensor domain-containing diguanylate cyclase [unclassified Caballeronia]|uniref:sensor domain-containing diguanylate cyclase n=1 Tax=unclassified Caballeronia TaxID=2646786 RepID=UPI001FD48762|nr:MULTISPECIES: sensor domain-containing diguanylate cyclase [unclassified Caballeronia]MDR5799398.1 diguanylate cyclase [Caballeronia sp. LZ001]
MSATSSLRDSILATPSTTDGPITAAIRASLLSTLVEDIRPLLLSGLSSAFVATIALLRLHALWTVLWLGADVLLLAARVGIVCRYRALSRPDAPHPEPWAARYAPFALLACLALGLGAMACVISGDTVLAALAIMVTAGLLGGIASRNAGTPYLVSAQICLGAAPIGFGALLAGGSFWMLVPPLFLYIGAMGSVVRRHYRTLVALMIAEQRHAELAARFDAALAHMPHGLCTVDAEGKVIIANRRAAELFGSTVEMLRLNISLPDFIGHAGLAKFGETLRAQLVERCALWLKDGQGALELNLADGRQLELCRNAVPDGSAVIIIEDVTERRRSEARLLHWAHHDSLTGLPNRRYLGDHAERLMANGAGREKVMVMYVDLDGFKRVNDTHGHNAGDELLTQAADRLRNAMRRGELVARLGGDEFAIVATYIARTSGAAFARRIIGDLSAPYELDDGGIARVGVSVGIALARRGELFESALKRADAALYEAKREQRGTYRFAAGDEDLFQVDAHAEAHREG